MHIGSSQDTFSFPELAGRYNHHGPQTPRTFALFKLPRSQLRPRGSTKVRLTVKALP